MDRPTEEARQLEILTAYVSGAISRRTAMEMMGLDWYGDLLVLLNQHGIARPTASHEQMAAMEEEPPRKDKGALDGDAPSAT